jgi:hypothetical protein
MKHTAKVITCGTSALFAAVLCLQAQSTTPSQPATTSPSQSTQSTTPSTPRESTTNRYEIGSETSPSSQSSSEANRWNSRDSNTGTTSDQNSQSSQNNNNRFQIGGDTSTSTSAQTGSETSVTANTEVETQVTTIVQQIDQQGPVVVERISTQFAEVACTQENARKLVEALHNGTEVTITGDDGRSATFRPTASLGYGDAYIAMALAAEALREAGITGCATPDQWKAVLLGGELAPAGTASVTTTTTTRSFPGILVLREQHGGWGQVAQTTNVQLGSVVSTARTSLNIDANSSASATASSSQNAQGRDSSSSRTVAGSSGESNQQSALGSQDEDDEAKRKEGEKGNSEYGRDNYGQNTARDNDWNKGKKKGHDKDHWKSEDESNSYDSENKKSEDEKKRKNPERR